MNSLCRFLITAFIFSSTLASVHAGVIIGGTRVVYDGNKKESSISVNNPDARPYLIQSWIDTINGGAEKAPFIVTPPLYRLDKEQQNIERIILSGTVPQDKESLYWLNIKAIPAASVKENSLQIAVKTRIKLIYRPATLSGVDLEEQATKLIWERNGNHLQVTNPGPYVLNFNEISIKGKKLDDVTYVLPESSARFTLPTGDVGGNVVFKIINDYGGIGAAHNAGI